MNDDRSLERRIASAYEEAAAAREPAGLLDDILLSTSRTRQRPHWLSLIKEPPMHNDSRLAVGSPTARVAAIMVATILATLLVASAGIAGARLLAVGPIVVDHTGNGTVETIAAAVAMADDGDEILIRPGTYAESIRVDKDISITGDGSAHEIIVEIADDGPTDVEIFGYHPRHAFYLDGVDATIGNLTITGPRSNISTFVVRGGSPTIHDVVANLEPLGGPAGFVFMDGGAGVIRDNTTDLFLWVDGGSTPEIAGNVSTDVIRPNGVGTDPWIHDNVVSGIWVHDGSAPLVQDNDVSGSANPDCAIEVAGLGARPSVRGNRVSGNDVGICVIDDTSIAELSGNTVTRNGIGIRVDSSSKAPDLAGNTICDNDQDLVGFGEGAPSDQDLCADVASP